MEYKLSKEAQMCADFQEAYMKKHPNNKNTFHNVYICQTIDRDGNVTDTKYGMNALTDFGLCFVMGTTIKDYPIDDGNDSVVYPFLNARYSSQCLGHYYDTGYSIRYTFENVVFGTGTYTPSLSELEFPSIWASPDTFIIDPNQGWGAVDLSATSKDHWCTYHNGVITHTHKFYTGYYDYNISRDGSTITSPATLTRIGVVVGAGWFNFYNAERTRTVNRPSIYDGKYFAVCHAQIYDKDGNVSSIVKNPDEKLVVSIWMSCSMSSYIYTKLWNNYGVLGQYSLDLAIRTIKGFRQYSYYSRFESVNCPMVEQGSSAVKRYVDDSLNYDNSYDTSFDNHVVKMRHPDLKISKLIEDKYLSLATFDIFGGLKQNGGSSSRRFHHLFIKPIYLDEPEELSSDEMYVAGTHSNIFDKRQLAYPNIQYPKFGTFNVRDFNITSIYRYNYRDHEWNIPVPFVAKPNNIYSDIHFRQHAEYKVLHNGVIKYANIYFNIYCNDVGIKGFSANDETSINRMYASDTFWDPDSWIEIPNFHNIPENLRNCKYYIITDPAWYNYEYNATGFVLTPEYDQEPMGLGSELDPKYFTTITVNGVETTINGESILHGKNYRSFGLSGSGINYYISSVNTRKYYFQGIGNDNTQYPWMLCGQSVLYFDGTISSIEKCYELDPNDIYTELSGYRYFSAMGRYQYKNRVAIQQMGQLYQFALYDFSDPTNAPTSWKVGSISFAAGDFSSSIAGNYYITTLQSGRYLATFRYNYSSNATHVDYVHVLDIGETGDTPTEYILQGVYQIFPILNTSYMLCNRSEVTNVDSQTFDLIDMDAYKIAVANEDPDPYESALIKQITVNANTDTVFTFKGCFGFNDNVYLSFLQDTGTTTTYVSWHYSIDDEVLTSTGFDNDLSYTFALKNNDYGSDKFNPKYTYRYDATNTNDGKNVLVLSSYMRFVIFREDQPLKPFKLNNEYTTGSWSAPYEYKTYYSDYIGYSVKYTNDGYYHRIHNEYAIPKYVNNQLLLITRGAISANANGDFSTESYYEQHMCLIMDLGLCLDEYDRNDSIPEDYFVTHCTYARDDLNFDQVWTDYNTATPGYSSWMPLKNKIVAISYQDSRIEILSNEAFLPLKVTGTTMTIQSYNNPKKVTMAEFPLTVEFTNAGLD